MNFINKCGKKIQIGTSVHSVTADNPNAYFNGKEWVYTSVESNSRVKKSIKHTEKYISDFLRYINALDGTSPEKYVKKLRL